MFIYLFVRERESTSKGGAERNRDTQNPKQAPGSELSAQSPMQGSNPQKPKGSFEGETVQSNTTG